ncbi:MAG: sensor domain-containing diguanylate cyclase [Eubacteriales bacterium]
MTELLLSFISKSERALVIGNVRKMDVFYVNSLMTSMYGVNMSTTDSFMEIFLEENRVLRKILIKQIKKKESSFFYDIVTRKVDGTLQLADLQVGYVNREESIMFMEITPKNDIRMESALDQIMHSSRAEGIFNLDEKLSLVHANELLYQVFELTKETAKMQYNNEFSNSFHPEVRATLLSEVHDKLTRSDSFKTKLKVITNSGEELWYSIEFQKRTLDNSGLDKVMVYMVNIEDQMKMAEELDTVNQYFSTMQSLSEDMLYRVDLRTKTLYRTSQQAEMLGISSVMNDYPNSILKSGMIHPEDIELYMSYGQTLLQGIATQVEIRLKSVNGEYSYRRLTCSPVFDDHGTPKEMFGKIVDIQMVRELEEQANFDSLTKALNKRAMLEATSQALSGATQKDNHALFFLDLDDFKYVNDNLGHTFGDYLLEEVGARLKSCIRHHDLVGRVGGDEFVIFLKGVNAEEILLKKATQMLSIMKSPFQYCDQTHSIAVSIGIARCPHDGITYQELYNCADKALYYSKENGKNLATIYAEQESDYTTITLQS